jgi:hypothetical protein
VSYSPQLRTAVLLTGNGTGGAYHAGVLRALHEAGVKIDVMSARGVGMVCALFGAIDAGAKTWEEGGVWRRRSAIRLYEWRGALRWAAAIAIAGIAVLLVPLVVLATGLVAYPALPERLSCSRWRPGVCARRRRWSPPDGTRRAAVIAIEAAGGRDSLVRRGAPSPGAGTCTRCCGSCFKAR